MGSSTLYANAVYQVVCVLQAFTLAANAEVFLFGAVLTNVSPETRTVLAADKIRIDVDDLA
jgi:hypothetical protein